MKIKNLALQIVLGILAMLSSPICWGQNTPGLTYIFNFDKELSHTPNDTNTDGSAPAAALVQGTDGNLYGTTTGLGPYSYGTLFKVTTSGTSFTVLHAFNDTDGYMPYGALLQGSDGNLYGTTSAGGPLGNGGEIFEYNLSPMAPPPLFTILINFGGGSYGLAPNAGLIQASDGYFYGTLSSGPSSNDGAIFKFSSAGGLTDQFTFTVDSQGNAGGGASPQALLQASDGYLYGTCRAGGTNGNYGVIFKILPSGDLNSYVPLHDFNLADGDTPSGLYQSIDPIFPATFYGTTEGGKSNTANQYGSVFKITSDGTFTPLYNFGGTDGASPLGGVLQDSNGNLYGTTQGLNGAGGTLYELTSTGVLKILYAFGSTNTDGKNPSAGLLRGTDGNFYGTTESGGTNGTGTIFVYKTGVPVVTSPTSAIGYIGQPFSYTISATNNATSYDVLNLQDSLAHVNGSTLISGTPTAAKAFTLTLYASNSFGKSPPVSLAVTIFGVPVINSPASATAVVGQPFSYQITATGNPTHYGVLGLLFPGFSVNAQTGVLTGTPTAMQVGAHTLTLQATNPVGTGTETFTLTITN